MAKAQKTNAIAFTIDGIVVHAKPGETIIQVADRYGIYIPRFCYHEQLSVVANCRMCLVEVANAPKTLPACATQVMPDMVVATKSPATIESQRAIMAFLLINHPLDCPICDKGGECELQDLAMGFGEEVSRFSEQKRTIHDDDIGPLIATDMTRCIHCTRCIRFGSEVAGIDELGLTGRGESMRVQTYIAASVHSELSGNYIDVCPVGALTSKPFRYKGRSWGFTQHHSIAWHDCLGSHLYVHTNAKGYQKKNDIMRVIPATNHAINGTWLADRDRFSYLGLRHKERAEHPMVKIGNQWQQVSWEQAITEVVRATDELLKTYGPKTMGCLVSPSATCEEGFILQKIVRSLGCVDIDHRLYLGCDTTYSVPAASGNMDSLPEYKKVIMLGSYLRHEQPILGARLRQAVLGKTQAISVNPRAYDWHFPVSDTFLVAGDAMVGLLQAVCAEVVSHCAYPVNKTWQNYLAEAKPTRQSRRLVRHALSQSVCWMLGEYALSHPSADLLHAMMRIITQATSAHIWYLTPGANSLGLHDVGVVPMHASGYESCNQGCSASNFSKQDKQVYWLHQVEPEYDMYDGNGTLEALEKAHFVLSSTSYITPTMLRYAKVILPLTTPTEMRGSYVNVFGQRQNTSALQAPYALSRPGWKVYRVLANWFEVAGCGYQVIEDVRKAMGEVTRSSRTKAYFPKPRLLAKPGLVRVGLVPLYREDSIVRRADALQETVDASVYTARIHSKTAVDLGVQAHRQVLVGYHEHTHKVALVIDDSLAQDCVWLPAALAPMVHGGPRHGYVTLQPVKEG